LPQALFHHRDTPGDPTKAVMPPRNDQAQAKVEEGGKRGKKKEKILFLTLISTPHSPCVSGREKKKKKKERGGDTTCLWLHLLSSLRCLSFKKEGDEAEKKEEKKRKRKWFELLYAVMERRMFSTPARRGKGKEGKKEKKDKAIGYKSCSYDAARHAATKSQDMVERREKGKREKKKKKGA